MTDAQRRVLVAGVGNIFLGDDAFGSEVARRLATRPLPAGVRVTDYGIGGIHLAYDLLGRVRASDSEPEGGDQRVRASDSEPEGGDQPVDLLVLVDALSTGAPAGTVSLLEVDPTEYTAGGTVDSHAMDPASVFATLRGLGGTLPPTVVVGCEPAEVTERIGLSAVVEAAVEPTIDQILALLDEPSAVTQRPVQATEVGHHA